MSSENLFVVVCTAHPFSRQFCRWEPQIPVPTCQCAGLAGGLPDRRLLCCEKM